jgi:hypothetical protein
MRLTKGWGVSLITGVLSILPAFTNIKIGSLQPEDFVLLGIMAFCISKWILGGFRFKIPSELSGLSKAYILLLLVILSFSILSVRLPFYPLDDASVLKGPVLYSLSRFLQLAAVVCGFFWLSSVFIRDQKRLNRAVDLYWRMGIVSSLYAVISYAALRAAHINLLGAYGDDVLRARGFFIEGGPFGLYLISVISVGFLRRHLTGKRIGYTNALIVAIAFLLSGSKAGVLALAILLFAWILSTASFLKKIVYLSLAAIVVTGFAMAIHIQEQINAYVESYQDIEYKIALVGYDTNLVMGRIAGAYIVPRMIAAHPITGIGIGNYPLMRNDPRYLGPLPSIRYLEDEPGLGVLGYASELGLPVTACLIILLFVPYGICMKSATIVVLASLVQVVSQLLGVQPTFFYPWFVSASAIAASRFQIVPRHRESPVHAFLQLSAQRPAAHLPNA